jgi:ribosomal-protein-alanine N-acetyltransferase
MVAVLTSERLQLRPGRIEDLTAVHQLWSDAGVRRFLFDDRTPSLEEARTFLERSVASFQRYGFGLWLVFRKGAPELIGFAGLLEAATPVPNLIYGIRADLWDDGLASEAAREVLRYALEDLKLAKVAADVDEPNAASVRVLEKLGMSRLKRAVVNDRPLLYFEIRRAPSVAAGD